MYKQLAFCEKLGKTTNRKKCKTCKDREKGCKIVLKWPDEIKERELDRDLQ